MILNGKVVNYKAEEIINIYKFCIDHFFIRHCLNGSQKWMRHFMKPGLQLLCFHNSCAFWCRMHLKFFLDLVHNHKLRKHKVLDFQELVCYFL
jgi:hypothetical protein